MKAKAAPFRSNGSTPGSWEEGGGLHVLALYEDFGAGIRVREALEWMRWEVKPGVSLKLKACSFSALTRNDLRAAATRDAAKSGILMVSAEAGRELPSHVEDWFGHCTRAHDNGPRIIVGLHGGERGSPAGSPPLCSCLQRIASRWRASFIGDDELEERLTKDSLLEIVGASKGTASPGRTVIRPHYSKPADYGRSAGLPLGPEFA